ncbi:YxlC family protein [Sutcliffiella rhizosphaerae]|uniref:YxlC family protein n=1 Tax=Sutcliffiella rhizosphaerae TaxID=2880967 RepID=A0ABM8YMZ7_9BACI|nr:YxlC family protein [Sutcliffiella rhizosphaerae]CAG9621374.1 putative protein YxlC [Sutcliffiella rhizosphaerae]
MKNNDDKKLFTRLQKDWEQLDTLGEPPIPTAPQLKEQLQMAKIKQRKAFQKEFALFIVTALIILTTFTTVISKAPMIFVITQAIAFIAAPTFYFLLRKSKQEGSMLT